MHAFAAVALTALLPVALAGCAPHDDRPSTAPVAASASSTGPGAPAGSTAAGPREHRAWPLLQRIRLDLDGDGVRDELRVREPDDLRGIEVTVDLADRTVVLPMPLTGSLDFQVYRHADLDGTPGEEVFVMKEVPYRIFRALTWRDDGFELITAPPAGTRLTDDLLTDGHRRVWWVDGVRVVSYRAREACEIGHDYAECPSAQTVDAQEWRVVDGRWRVRALGRFCVTEPRWHRLAECE